MEKSIVRPGCTCVYELLDGERGLTVVLIHGYGVHRDMWTPQVAALQAAGYPVINIDVRGHGRSRPTDRFDVVLAAEDIHAILEAEGVDKYMLCGLSMGAFVAQEYALRFGGARGYMLTGVTPLFAPYPRWEKVLLSWSGPMMKWLYTWNALKKAMVKGSACTANAQAQLSVMFDVMNKAEFLVSWAGFSTCLHEEAYRYTAPLLVAAGGQDTRGTIMKHLPDWEGLYPDCRVETIAGAGHVANLDQPERFSELLLAFVRQCETTKYE